MDFRKANWSAEFVKIGDTLYQHLSYKTELCKKHTSEERLYDDKTAQLRNIYHIDSNQHGKCKYDSR